MPPRGCSAVRSRHNRLRRTRRAFKRPRSSLKDLGSKCFGFAKMDAGAIRGIKKSAFGSGAKSSGLV